MRTLRTTNRNRREVLKLGAAVASAAALVRPALAQGAPRVVVVGGGFAGASFARALRKADPRIAVTLIAAEPTFTACPLSSAVIAGLRDIAAQRFTYEKVKADGVTVAPVAASGIDAQARTVTLGDGTKLSYDRLVLAPGIALRFDAVQGYSEQAAEILPHAWTAGAQTLLLKRQLEAMQDGGTVVISAPVGPYRCPPAPYERASLIAHYLKTNKPRSKVIVLDAKEAFSQERLFQNAWNALYPGMIEWVPPSKGGELASVDPATKTFRTDFDEYKASVGNLIPPQKAGRIAELAGAADRSGWCPIEPASFESKRVPNVHVIGDAAFAGPTPKSAFSANVQSKACATAVAKLLRGEKPAEPELISTCFSVVAPDYGFSIRAVYRPMNGEFVEVEGSSTTSPVDASPMQRLEEAVAAEGLFGALTREAFG